MNDNFGKLAGVLVFEGTNTAAVTVDDTTTMFGSRCNAYIDDCAVGLYEFASPTVNTGVTHSTDTDSNSGANSSTTAANFSIITVGTSGWYDIYMSVDFTSYLTDFTNGSNVFITQEFFLQRYQNLVTVPVIESNANINGDLIGSVIAQRKLNDLANFGVVDKDEDFTIKTPGFYKRVYLSSGEKLYVGYKSIRKAVQNGDFLTVGAGSFKLRIVYLP